MQSTVINLKSKASTKIMGRDDLSEFDVLPVADSVYVERLDSNDKQIGSIILNRNNSVERYFRARVIEVGPGKYQNGVHIPVRVSVGDIILHRKNHFDAECDIGDRYVVDEGDIRAKLFSKK